MYVHCFPDISLYLNQINNVLYHSSILSGLYMESTLMNIISFSHDIYTCIDSLLRSIDLFFLMTCWFHIFQAARGDRENVLVMGFPGNLKRRWKVQKVHGYRCVYVHIYIYLYTYVNKLYIIVYNIH